MAVALLETADAVLEAWGARDRPRASEGLVVAQVGPELCLFGAVVVRLHHVVLLGGEAGLDHGQVRDVGETPGLGAVGEVAVGEQHHRGAVGDRDPDRLDGGVEAVARRLRRHDRHRRLAVAAEHRLQQVGLLGLGGQARRGAAALHVDDEQRELGHHRETDGLGLERDAGAGGRGDAQLAGERRTDRGADAGDLVLGLERRDAERLVLRELVEDVGGRGDRVGAEHDVEAGLHAAGDQPVGQGQVAADVAVDPWRHRSRLHFVLDDEGLGGLAEVPPGLERRDVGVADVRDLGEPLAEEVDRGLGRPAVHPRQQPEREHVLGPGGVLARQAELLDRLDGHPGQVHREDLEVAQLVVGVTERRERVRRVAGLGQVAVAEVVGVHDDRRALGQVGQVGLERGRVHRDQHVGSVARGEDVVVGEVHLERRDTGQRALGCADLRGEVRQRHQVVAEGRRLLGEPVSGQLHPVPGVAGEPDDDPIDLLDLLRHVVAPPRCNQSWCSSHTYDEACWLGVLGFNSVIRRPSIVPAVCEH